MKTRFEKAFRENAYAQVPDRWDEIQEKLRAMTPEVTKDKVVRMSVRSLATIAASVTIILVAVSVAVGVGSRKSTPDKSEITVTDENGVSYTLTDVSDFDSIAVPETTVIFYKDSNGVEHTTVATITRNAQGQREDSSVVVTFKDAEGNMRTTVVEIPAEPSPTNSVSSDSAPQADPATTAATTRAETVREVIAQTMPEKYPVVQFDPTGLPDGLAKEYDFALRGNEYISRPATLLYKNYTLYNINPKTDKEETATADIYVFQNFSRKLAVGVKFRGEEKIHPYVNVHYTPQTLGDFLSDADVRNTVHFGNIRLYKDGTFPVNDQNKADIWEYLLSDGSIKNTNATDRPSGTKVTLSIDLAELGKRNKVMEVYESGYVYTNLLGYGCTFNVGKANVAAFLKNSYNVTFDDLANVNSGTPSTTSDATTAITNDPTVSQPYFVEGTTAMTTQPHTIPE